jgi:hypothetical protein
MTTRQKVRYRGWCLLGYKIRPARRKNKAIILYYNPHLTLHTNASLLVVYTTPTFLPLYYHAIIMKCGVTILSAFAVSIVSVRASPIYVDAQQVVTAQPNPFVSCIRQTYPRFPTEGTPTQQQLQACYPRKQPTAKRADAATELGEVYPDAPQPAHEPNPSNLVQSRGLPDVITVLGQQIGLSQKAQCLDEIRDPSTLPREFAWATDVAALAEDLCKKAVDGITVSGLNEDGGIGYAVDRITNAHQNGKLGYLINKQQILVTLAVSVFPKAGATQDTIKTVAQGILSLCPAAVRRITDTNAGCTGNVKYYESQTTHTKDVMAALGGYLDVFRDSANSVIGEFSLEFSEDTD